MSCKHQSHPSSSPHRQAPSEGLGVSDLCRHTVESSDGPSSNTVRNDMGMHVQCISKQLPSRPQRAHLCGSRRGAGDLAFQPELLLFTDEFGLSFALMPGPVEEASIGITNSPANSRSVVSRWIVVTRHDESYPLGWVLSRIQCRALLDFAELKAWLPHGGARWRA